MTDKKSREIEVPAHGALGLLALGDLGVDLWRKKRNEVLKQKRKEEKGKDEEK